MWTWRRGNTQGTLTSSRSAKKPDTLRCDNDALRSCWTAQPPVIPSGLCPPCRSQPTHMLAEKCCILFVLCTCTAQHIREGKHGILILALVPGLEPGNGTRILVSGQHRLQLLLGGTHAMTGRSTPPVRRRQTDLQNGQEETFPPSYGLLYFVHRADSSFPILCKQSFLPPPGGDPVEAP